MNAQIDGVEICNDVIANILSHIVMSERIKFRLVSNGWNTMILRTVFTNFTQSAQSAQSALQLIKQGNLLSALYKLRQKGSHHVEKILKELCTVLKYPRFIEFLLTSRQVNNIVSSFSILQRTLPTQLILDNMKPFLRLKRGLRIHDIDLSRHILYAICFNDIEFIKLTNLNKFYLPYMSKADFTQFVISCTIEMFELVAFTYRPQHEQFNQLMDNRPDLAMRLATLEPRYRIVAMGHKSYGVLMKDEKYRDFPQLTLSHRRDKTNIIRERIRNELSVIYPGEFRLMIIADQQDWVIDNIDIMRRIYYQHKAELRVTGDISEQVIYIKTIYN